MLVLQTLFAALLCYISWAKYLKAINPVSVILVWYYSLIWLSRVGIQDMYIPSIESNALIMLNINLLSIVILLLSKGGLVKVHESARKLAMNNDKTLLNDRPWLFSIRKYGELICFFVVCVIDANILIKLITGTITASQIRYALIFQEASNGFNSDFLYFNSFIRDFLTYFVRFFVFFDLLIEVCGFGLYNKQLKILPMVNFGLFCIAMLTRIDILKVAILFIIVCFFIKKRSKTRKMSKRNKHILRIAVLFAGIVIGMRVYEGDSIIDFTVRNFSGSLIGPFEAFSIYFDSFRANGPLVDFAVIRVFFGGITAIIEAFLVNYLHLNIPFTIKIINSTFSDIIYVGPGQTFNAFYTMYYDFLASGGVIGTIFGTLLTGSALAISYNHYQKRPSTSSCMLFVLWEYIIIFGVIQWRAGLTEWACIVFILLGNRIIVGKRIHNSLTR